MCAGPLMCRTHRANTLGCDDIYTNYDTIKGEDTAKKKKEEEEFLRLLLTITALSNQLVEVDELQLHGLCHRVFGNQVNSS